MQWIQKIKRLKNTEPNIEKTVKNLKKAGIISIAIGLWNFILPLLESDFSKEPFNLSASYPITAIILSIIVSIPFFYASKLLKERNIFGKIIAKLSIIIAGIATVAMFSFVFQGFPLENFGPIGIIFPIIAVVQFLLPAYYSYAYINRITIEPKQVKEIYNEIKATESFKTKSKYVDSFSPLGLPFTFFVILGGGMLFIQIFMRFTDESLMPVVFIPFFASVFIVPMIFNNRTSPFEEGREMISSHICSGQIGFFQGSAPFFKLVVYKDSIEVRVFFHRYWLPFAEVDEISSKRNRMTIISDLPDVPESIMLGIKSDVHETIVGLHNNQTKDSDDRS